jgi:dipeptidyl aminopeptidase/acylaminoacyl peptidase
VADGLFRVAAAGGKPVPVTSLQKNEAFHQHPQFLPDGRRFLYFAAPDGVFLGSLDGRTPVRVLTNSQKAVYSPLGYLLFVEDRTLFAQRFDVDDVRLSGERIPLGEHVRTGGQAVDGRAVGGAAISVSDKGVLAYGTDVPLDATLAWRDRTGRVVGSIGPFPFERFGNAELSPDGSRIALETYAIPFQDEVWLFELATGRSTQLTFNSWPNRHPIWSPDGNAVAFASGRSKAPGIYGKRTTGEQAEEVLVAADANRVPWPTDWTSRGIVYEAPDTGAWMLPLGKDRQPYPLVREQPGEPDAKFSPDGKWLAYSSREPGRSELFVQSASARGAKWRISPAGGSMPRWRRDGKELFYVASDGVLMAVSIEVTDETLRPGVPQPLFATGLSTMPLPLRSFNVSLDGQRFLMATPEPSTGSSSLVVVSNWPAVLKRRD